MSNYNWVITKKQITDCDIESAIIHVDPEQIADADIRGLHGAVRLRVERAAGAKDIFGKKEARKFFQALHARWPYAGYFLRLTPISKSSTPDQIVDVSLFMALALCHVGDLACCQTTTGTALRFNLDRLARHLAEVACRAMDLADCIGISEEAVQKRDHLITASAVSFFRADQSLGQRIKNHRKSL